MKRLLDYNPITREALWFDYQASDDRMVLRHEQDVSPIIDEATAARNDTDYSRGGIRDDWWHYARLPNIVIIDMKQRFGVDLLAPKVDWKAALKIINREYPAFKMTTGTHA